MIYLKRLTDNQEIAFDVSDILQLPAEFDYVNNNVRIKQVYYDLASLRIDNGGSTATVKQLIFRVTGDLLKKTYAIDPITNVPELKQYLIVSPQLMAFTHAPLAALENISIRDDFKVFKNNVEMPYGVDWFFRLKAPLYGDPSGLERVNHKGWIDSNENYFVYHDFIVFRTSVLDSDVITIRNTHKKSMHKAPMWQLTRTKDTYENFDRNINMEANSYFLTHSTSSFSNEVNEESHPYHNIILQNFISIPKTKDWIHRDSGTGELVTGNVEYIGNVEVNGNIVPNTMKIGMTDSNGMGIGQLVLFYPELLRIINIDENHVIERWFVSGNSGRNEEKRLKPQVLGNELFYENYLIRMGCIHDTDSHRNKKMLPEKYRLRNLLTNEVTDFAGFFSVKKIQWRSGSGNIIGRFKHIYFPSS